MGICSKLVELKIVNNWLNRCLKNLSVNFLPGQENKRTKRERKREREKKRETKSRGKQKGKGNGKRGKGPIRMERQRSDSNC